MLIVVALNQGSSKPGALGESPTYRRARPGRAAAASPLAAAPASLCLCHGSDSRVDWVGRELSATTELCAPHNWRLLTDDRGFAAWRLPERAQRPAGVASETWTGSGPITSENAERCVGAGSGLQLRRAGGGGRRATRARRFGVLRCLDVRACDFHRACASAGHGARARQPALLTARMMGHGLGLAAQHYAERDGLEGAALCPAGGGMSW